MSEAVLQQLAERVTRLEEELRQLKSQVGEEKGPKKPWWEQIAGSQKGDKVFEEIVRLGAKIRRAERAAARGKGKKTQPKKGRAKGQLNAKE